MPDRDRYDDWADKLFDADCWCDTKKPYTCKACFARQTIAAALRQAADEAREECAKICDDRAASWDEVANRIPETDSENRSSRKAARQLRSVAAAIRATIGGSK